MFDVVVIAVREEAFSPSPAASLRLRAHCINFVCACVYVYLRVLGLFFSLVCVFVCACVIGEKIEITYSYWDGRGHRATIEVTKGTAIKGFLAAVQKEWPELRGTSVDGLMYIKEDLIIPHHYSFYDLILTKARGKSGPLFKFDVHDDVRMLADATVEKDETHAGKVCERRWFESNKHIFPASRWEVSQHATRWWQRRAHCLRVGLCACFVCGWSIVLAHSSLRRAFYCRASRIEYGHPSCRCMIQRRSSTSTQSPNNVVRVVRCKHEPTFDCVRVVIPRTK